MPIHSIVCIKSVVRTAPDGVGRVHRKTANSIPSTARPWKRPCASRRALGGTVTVLSMGPPVGTEALAEAQAMGVDRAVLVCDAALAGSDTLVTSRVLAAAIQRLAPYDFVFFGTRTSDSDTGQVGPQTATLLGDSLCLGRQADGAPGAGLGDHAPDGRLAGAVAGQVPAAVSIHPRFYAPRADCPGRHRPGPRPSGRAKLAARRSGHRQRPRRPGRLAHPGGQARRRSCASAVAAC